MAGIDVDDDNESDGDTDTDIELLSEGTEAEEGKL